MFAFLISVALGLYFRTYLLHQSTTLQPQKVAAYFVKQALAKKFEKAIEVQNPNLSGDDKLKFAREQAERMIQSDPANYQKTVSEALMQIKGSIPKSSGRHYLLEADPYYYYYLTEQIIQHGKIAEKVKGGQYFHPLMHAPYGYWTALTWHPHVGFQIARIVRFVLPEIDWMEALCWVPLVLSVLACFCFLLLAKSMEVNVFSFFLILSPLAL